MPTRDGAYRSPEEYGSTVRFVTLDDGTPAMVTGFTYAEAANGTVAELRYLLLGIVMVLFRAAPVWAIGVLAFGAARRRRVLPTSLVVWPAVAGIACAAFSRVLFLAFIAA